MENLTELCDCKKNKGRKLYDTYGSWVDHKAFDGEKLKEFDELPEIIQIAWVMTANGKKKEVIESEDEENPKPKKEKQPKPKKEKPKPKNMFKQKPKEDKNILNVTPTQQ